MARILSELLWLWCRLAATAPIRPLAWEPPYAKGAAQEMAKRQKKNDGEGVKKREFWYTIGGNEWASLPVVANSLFPCDRST